MTGPSRRAVLLGGLAGAGALVTAGCGRSPGGPAGTAPTASTVPAHRVPSAAALGSAVEGLAATAYGQLGARLATGALGTPPAAVTALLARGRAAHLRQAAAWGGAGDTSGSPTLTLAAGTLRSLAAVSTLGPGLRILAGLERTAAATYLQLAGAAAGGDRVASAGPSPSAEPEPAAVAALAVSCAPVAAQLGAVLAVLLGQTPAPDAFLSTSGALGTGALENPRSTP